jgi:hypothetical protein
MGLSSSDSIVPNGKDNRRSGKVRAELSVMPNVYKYTLFFD